MTSDVKIPASVWIIVGAGMILMSVFVGLNADNIEKFTLFILAGAVFIVYGFFRILMKEKKEAKKLYHPQPHHAEHHVAHPAEHHKPAHPHAEHPHKPAHPAHPAQQAHAAQSAQPHVVRCSNCGVKLHHMFKFCPNCGQRLK